MFITETKQNKTKILKTMGVEVGVEEDVGLEDKEIDAAFFFI